MPDANLTLAEAAEFLDPGLDEWRLRLLVKALGIRPTGRRRLGRLGPPQHVYDAAELIELHAAVAKWLARMEDPLDDPFVPQLALSGG